MHWLLLLGIVAVCLIYSRGLDGPWLYDDMPNLVDNHQLAIQADVVDEWRTASFSSGAGVLRRPLSMLSFTAEHALQGELRPATSKAVNLVIHSFNGLLVYLLCLQLMRSPRMQGVAVHRGEWIAAGAALLWLVLPLHLSTVLYAVQRMAQMSTLFVLLGLYVFARYRHAWSEQGGTPGDVLAAVLWMLLLWLGASLSKENGLLLPWLVAVVEFCFYRGRWRGKRIAWFNTLAWFALLLPAIVLVLIGLVGPDWLINRYATRDFTLGERMFTQARLLWQYLGWIVWPDIAHMGLHHDAVRLSTGLLAPVTTLISLLAWCMVILAGLVLRNRAPLLLFALAFYLVGHASESTIWPLMLAFEHRSYLPSVGVCLLLASLLCWRPRGVSQARFPWPLAGALGICLVMLNFRAAAWSNADTLHAVDVHNHPDSSRSHYVYGNALLRDFQAQRAEATLEKIERRDRLVAIRYHFGEAARLYPEDVAVLVTLYQLDSNYFAALNTAPDWLARLRQEIARRPLRPADVGALKSLMRCLAKESCPGGESLTEDILAELEQVHPGRADRFILRHLYQEQAGVEAARRMAGLRDGLVLFPGDQRLQYRLLREAAFVGNAGLAYEMGRQIMRGDPHRWQQSTLRKIYHVAPQ
ncbi:hypothetical protein [Halioglobus japonicus]|uniref:hypothetical protein n=1 Tax=Halioglobus japonicus TaxID=930805 RepID=UPI0012F52964|nr:hypothetical protein [Halioglobus japonicus]